MSFRKLQSRAVADMSWIRQTCCGLLEAFQLESREIGVVIGTGKMRVQPGNLPLDLCNLTSCLFPGDAQSGHPGVDLDLHLDVFRAALNIDQGGCQIMLSEGLFFSFETTLQDQDTSFRNGVSESDCFVHRRHGEIADSTLDETLGDGFEAMPIGVGLDHGNDAR